ncbi:MAG: lipid-A-disaccharide synthase [Nitrospinota bacterium]|nr:lipid-A-disaccharide synthase [Nitrospinota bacterium]
MNSHPSRIMIIAGEASGDFHASRLVDSILEQSPNVSFSGMGGAQMQSAGVDILHSCENISVTGFLDAIKVIPELRKIRSDLVEYAIEKSPDIVIFVDFPGFNTNLVRKLKKNLVKSQMVYFIPPQIWGWRPARAKKIADFFDLVLTIFPFEKQFFEKYNVHAHYIGNPICFELMNKTKTGLSKEHFGIDDSYKIIAFVPGSRKKELNRHLPHMIDAARILHPEFSKTVFVISEANSLPKGIIDSALLNSEKFILPYRGELSELLGVADFAVVSSGTASLEASVMGLESILLYRTDFITYLLCKYFLMRVDYVGLTNLIIGEEVVPELLQRKVNGVEIANSVRKILEGRKNTEEKKSYIKDIRKKLSSSDPYKNASEIILEDWFVNAQSP